MTTEAVCRLTQRWSQADKIHVATAIIISSNRNMKIGQKMTKSHLSSVIYCHQCFLSNTCRVWSSRCRKKSKNYIQIKHEHLFFLFEILPLQSRIKRDAEERGKSNHPALLISFNSEQTNTTNREQNGEQAEPVSLTDISVKDSNAIKYRRRRFSLNHWRNSVDVPD